MSTSKPCAYVFYSSDDPCPEPAYESSDYCVLHIDLPLKTDPDFETIVKAKHDRTQGKIDAGDFNFEGANLPGFKAELIEVNKANFLRATFGGNAQFGGATFVGLYAWFVEATFYNKANFSFATFNCNAWFGGATFYGEAEFGSTTFVRELTAHNAVFNDPTSQEGLCMAAKRNSEGRGDREEADYYHYREMEAKRMQKWRPRRYLEMVPFQWILGYGVKPLRTFGIWLSAVFGFALYYWLVQALNGANSPASYFYFSTMTAITPGYGNFSIRPEMYPAASIEAIFGAFMWVAFIAVLTRKYFRS